MTEELQPAKVIVELKSSSTKDGKEGYRVLIADGVQVTDLEVDETVRHALNARAQVCEALGLDVETKMLDRLRESVNGGEA